MITTIMVLLFIFVLILLLWQISNMVSVFYGSPYVMTEKKVISEALRLAKLKKGEIFYDLGCGRGDVVIEAAKFGTKPIGFEISPYSYILAKIRTSKYPTIKIVYKNIYSINLSKADVVYCYLMPKILEKLSSKFKKELKKGNRLISVGFPILPAPASKMGKYKINGRKIFIYK